VAAEVDDAAWLRALLEVEAALARAGAVAGLVPADAAEAIGRACLGTYDVGELGRAAAASGNPVVPLVRALEQAAGPAGRWVHLGATSQDVLDTAASLVARRAVTLVDDHLRAVARRCAGLAEQYRDTPVVGRTLLQQALPTTFGLKAAGWLDAVLDARAGLAAVPFAVQLGGAAGTLASLGAEGTRVLGLVASGLGLDEPVLPWHTARGRVAALGAALALAAGTAEKVAGDILLLAQTEVGEVTEASDGRGGSSTMPHKRNPVGAVLAVACARRVRGEASILTAAVAQEHERAAGAWQAEWEAVNGALAYTGGAAAALRESLRNLEVRPERMRRNLEATGGLVMAEAVGTALLETGLGRDEAHALVGEAAGRGGSFRDALLEEPRIAGALGEGGVDAALDPASYLGSAGAFVDRALDRWREEEG
jgi:3-carboxy-cis,cis-muconate cycloisomerase